MSDPIIFDSATVRFELPLLFAGQAQKEFFFNEALTRTDLLLHAAIESEIAAPPTTPAVGSVWLVAASPTGAFAGHAHSLAGWTSGGWRFVVPTNGLRVFDKEIAAFRLYRGGWHKQVAPPEPIGGTAIDLEARASIAAILEKLVDAGVFATN